MEKSNCSNCPFRTKYDNNPKSFTGRFWRWHINFCPGWKKYFTTLDDGQKDKLSIQYNFKKYM